MALLIVSRSSFSGYSGLLEPLFSIVTPICIFFKINAKLLSIKGITLSIKDFLS